MGARESEARVTASPPGDHRHERRGGAPPGLFRVMSAPTNVGSAIFKGGEK